jgi:hypothetical protein
MEAAMVAAYKWSARRRGTVMSQKIRSAALVLALSALFVSSAYALPPAHAAAGPRTEGLLTAAWNWFALLVLPAAPVHTAGKVAIWEKAGSQAIPRQQFTPGNLLPLETTDAGSQMDPNGHS